MQRKRGAKLSEKSAEVIYVVLKSELILGIILSINGRKCRPSA